RITVQFFASGLFGVGFGGCEGFLRQPLPRCTGLEVQFQLLIGGGGGAGGGGTGGSGGERRG
ncbi:hypothetical protein, partial [Pseudomonas syringae group genomosp. 7]|uniref:hypothetical protein n=1 Tax=Pseudomonas syringae group genomosp. 7 TaxID=251699 RepID=UPI0037703D62